MSIVAYIYSSYYMPDMSETLFHDMLPSGDGLSHQELEPLTGRELLVFPMGDETLPRIVIDSFEGIDVPFDRDEWRDRTLRLVRRKEIESRLRGDT